MRAEAETWSVGQLQTRQEEGEEMLLLQTGMSVQQSAVAGALAVGGS